MTVAGLSIKHPVTTFMVFVALFLLGMVSLSRVPLDLFPDISMPTVAIYTTYAGVGPFEVEAGVTKPIEEALSSMNGVEGISSTSSEGVSLIIVNFAWSKDMDTVVSDIREQLNQVEDLLPEGAERPGIFKFNPQFLPSLVVNVHADVPGLDLRRLAEKEIVPALEKVDGVARAEVYGGRITAVVCRLDLDAIGKLEIPMMQILRAFQGENVDLPAGHVTVAERYLILRTIGEFRSVEDIGRVLVGYRNAVPIFLHDVAEIKIDRLHQEQFVRSGGADAVTVAVRRQPGHNTVKVNEAALKVLRRVEASLPESVRVTVRTDQSQSIMHSIGSVASAAWQGGLLAIVVLLFFLRNVRSTLIIAVVIPVSVVATFSLMDFGGLSMNMVSLMGITLGVGMFVDNSIVVLESSYRKQLAGLNPEKAALEGAAEVSRPIIASTLTTVSVFVPMLFVEGIAGLIFDDLSMTISFALLVSLAVALSLIPLLCAKLLRVDIRTVRPDPLRDHHELSLADVEVHTGNRLVDAAADTFRRALAALDDVYERVVSWALDHSTVVILSALVVLAASVGSVLLLGMEFLPETDEGEFSVSLETKIGSSYDVTTAKVVQMERIVMEALGPDLVSLSSQIGRGGSAADAGNVGSNLGVLHVALVEKDRRKRDIWLLMREIDARFKAEVIDVRYTMVVEGIGALATTATGESDAVAIELSGNDLDALVAVAGRIEESIAAVSGIRNVRVSHQGGKPELQFRINRREALSLGLSPLEIAASIRAAYKGVTVSRFSTDQDTYDVVVMLREEDRAPERFPSLFFIGPSGAKIPLENLVDIEEGTGPLSVKRKERTRVVTVTAGLTGERPLNRVMQDVRSRVSALGPAPLGIDLAYTGGGLQMAESYESLIVALLFALALVYMVMASQFESLLHPFIVMFSVPFAAIGLVGALLVTRTTFSLLAFVGAILLVGIVVNNAIVLIDYMNLLRKKGVPLRRAIVLGGKTRLKPILMTSLTTVFGLLPMSLGIGAGSEIRAPMGRAVVGGLTTSTLVTLVLIPVIYWLIEKRRRKTDHVTLEAHAAPL